MYFPDEMGFERRSVTLAIFRGKERRTVTVASGDAEEFFA